jgi:CubicO group peptidase (beta-lactamase class C family)
MAASGSELNNLTAMPGNRMSRRRALSMLAAAACGAAANTYARAQTPALRAAVDNSTSPTFVQGGPDAKLYGFDKGYPVPDPTLAMREGNPWSPGHRVGAFSHLDAIHPTRRISPAAIPWTFRRSTAEFRYSFQGHRHSPADYLSRRPVTGLLIARDDQILFEQYQYGRTDSNRLLAQSMVKSIVGMLMGIAVAEGAIKSVDDTAENYVPGFKGSEYGRTPIRDLLHMSSGVDFGEERDDGRDLDRLWRDMVSGVAFKKGTVGSITQFNHRIAPPGTKYRYASIEAAVLGLVLHYATDKSASDYLQEKVWHPIGAEADATWLVDAEGMEVAHFGFSAVLRDYARLGRLLACDGAWGSKQILPVQWMIDATTVRRSDAYLAPGRAMPTFGYGYLLWLLPGNRRQFALVGQLGQRICIDPASKLVMVHTALDEPRGEDWALWSAVVTQLGQG